MSAHAKAAFVQRVDPWIIVYFLLSVLVTASLAVVLALYESLNTVFVVGATSRLDTSLISLLGIATPLVPIGGLFVGLLVSYVLYSRYGRWSAGFADSEELFIARQTFTRYFLVLIATAIPYLAIQIIGFFLSITVSFVVSDFALYLFGGSGLFSSVAFLWDYYDLYSIAQEKGGRIMLHLTSDRSFELTAAVMSLFGGYRLQLLDPRVKYIHIAIAGRYGEKTRLPIDPTDSTYLRKT